MTAVSKIKVDAARGDPAKLAALVADLDPYLAEAIAALPRADARAEAVKKRDSDRVSAALAYFDELRSAGSSVRESLEAAADKFGYDDPETLRKARTRRSARQALNRGRDMNAV